MKEILKYARESGIANANNSILEKALGTQLKEDRVMKIITKEVITFVTRLFINKESHEN